MRTSLILLLVALAAVRTADAVTDAERIQVYREFRTLFDARKYQEALPVAQRLVTMTEEQYGADAQALATPLTNLGTTFYRLKEFPSAEKSYLRSVEILEATGSNADRSLMRPLHGLGATYLAVGQFEDATIALKRAIDLSRNLDGLFNVEQLAILEPLIAGYVALEQRADAEKEHQYALRVAETTFGKTDMRMLGPLERYARWLEHVGRYTTARVLYARALSIAEKGAGRGTVAGVDALQGIARTYRLEYINGSEEEAGLGGEGYIGSDAVNAQRLNPDGERALKLALAALDKAPTPDHKRRGETLVELGDWYVSGGATSKGMEAYALAWKELQETGSTALLEAPRLLAYRPPTQSIMRSRLTPEEADEFQVDATFTVTADGRVQDVVTKSDNASDSLQKSVATAARKARYSPRFENGEPVATPDVVIKERLLMRKPQQQRSS